MLSGELKVFRRLLQRMHQLYRLRSVHRRHPQSFHVGNDDEGIVWRELQTQIAHVLSYTGDALSVCFLAGKHKREVNFHTK